MDNSLNYCKLKFGVDTGKIRIRRLQNALDVAINSIESQEFKLDKELETSLLYLPESEIVISVRSRIKQILKK